MFSKFSNTASNQISSDKLLGFVQQLCKLEELEVVGLVNLMGIDLVDLDKNPRTFEEILSDMIDQYIAMNRDKRKKIDYVLNETLNGRDDTAPTPKKHRKRKHSRKH